MAVISVGRDYSKTSGSITLTGRKYVHAYKLLTDGTESEQQALEASGIPPYGQVHPDDSGAFIVDKSIANLGDQNTAWLITCEYSTPQGLSGSADLDPDPFARPVEIEYSTVYNSRVVEKSVLGNAIATPADEVFDPPVEVEELQLIVAFTRNEPSFSPITNLRYQNKINKFPWFGVDQYQARCTVIQPTRKTEGSVSYWSVRYEFAFRGDPDGDDSETGYPVNWNPVIINRGFIEKIGGEPRQIVDKDGKAISKPMLLQDDGTRLAIGGTPTYSYFQIYKEADFNLLGLA